MRVAGDFPIRRYYRKTGESAYNEHLMRLTDEEYARHPFYGSRRITAWLKRQGYEVNPKRVSRLMGKMGVDAVYQKPNLSRPSPEHKKYPYLLKGVAVKRSNHVWSGDITYIRMRRGFVYLTAVMDWYSRCVLSYEISTSMDAGFCVTAPEKALNRAKPEIFSTDQGSQFASTEFTGILNTDGIKGLSIY